MARLLELFFILERALTVRKNHSASMVVQQYSLVVVVEHLLIYGIDAAIVDVLHNVKISVQLLLAPFESLSAHMGLLKTSRLGLKLTAAAHLDQEAVYEITPSELHSLAIEHKFVEEVQLLLGRLFTDVAPFDSVFDKFFHRGVTQPNFFSCILSAELHDLGLHSVKRL